MERRQALDGQNLYDVLGLVSQEFFSETSRDLSPPFFLRHGLVRRVSPRNLPAHCFPPGSSVEKWRIDRFGIFLPYIPSDRLAVHRLEKVQIERSWLILQWNLEYSTFSLILTVRAIYNQETHDAGTE